MIDDKIKTVLVWFANKYGIKKHLYHNKPHTFFIVDSEYTFELRPCDRHHILDNFFIFSLIVKDTDEPIFVRIIIDDKYLSIKDKILRNIDERFKPHIEYEVFKRKIKVKGIKDMLNKKSEI